jgi:demethylmenaquinone methyltransferase/2-methoxy-6-polyprenyl-1,4-benzoquinol methylase
VRKLFATIADRYDLITVLLSYGQDWRWKRRLIELADLRPDERVLDLACGTGDLLFAAIGRARFGIGLDVTFRMLQLAAGKAAAHSASGPTGPAPRARVAFVAGDMVALPIQSARFEVVTTGYGLRNVPDLHRTLNEIHRVLVPGGRFLSLDFNRPQNPIVRVVYLTYLTVVGSTLGFVLHGDPDTYRYIPASIRQYPGAAGVARLLEQHGFDSVRVVPVLAGLMAIHVARRV